MASITIVKPSEKQKKKRLQIQKRVIDLMNRLELSEEDYKNGKESYNAKMWKTKFQKMSDLEFHKMMIDFKENKSHCFTFEAAPVTDKKEKMNINKLNKIAKDFGFKLREYVMFPHKNRENPNVPMISKSPLPILIITVKRLQQMLAKKNKASSDTSSVNYMTNQVTGDSKAAKISNTQTYALLATKQTSCIKEYLSVRADDDVAKKQMFKEIADTGKAHLKNYDISTANKQSVQTFEVMLRAAGLRTNILQMQRQKKNASMSKENIDILDLNNFSEKYTSTELSIYRNIVVGVKYYNNDSLFGIPDDVQVQQYDSKICELIKNYKPNYILCDRLPPFEIISPEDAFRKYSSSNSEDYIYENYNLKNIYKLAYDYKITLVSLSDDIKYIPDAIDAPEEHYMKTISKMDTIKRKINQFRLLDDVQKRLILISDFLLCELDRTDYNIEYSIIDLFKKSQQDLVLRDPNTVNTLSEKLVYIFSKVAKINNGFKQYIAVKHKDHLDTKEHAIIGFIKYQQINDNVYTCNIIVYDDYKLYAKSNNSIYASLAAHPEFNKLRNKVAGLICYVDANEFINNEDWMITNNVSLIEPSDNSLLEPDFIEYLKDNNLKILSFR